MPESSDVVANAQALATEYNNLRKDVLDPALGHDHSGAAGHGKALDILILKSADEIVNNSAVLQNDDEFLFAVLANEIWKFRLLMHIAIRAASDFRYVFTIPVAGTLNGYDNISITDNAFRYIVPLDLTASRFIASGINGDVYVIVWGVYIGGANAGNVQLQWAQNAAVAEDTKMLENSFIIARQLA